MRLAASWTRTLPGGRKSALAALLLQLLLPLQLQSSGESLENAVQYPEDDEDDDDDGDNDDERNGHHDGGGQLPLVRRDFGVACNMPSLHALGWWQWLTCALGAQAGDPVGDAPVHAVLNATVHFRTLKHQR